MSITTNSSYAPPASFLPPIQPIAQHFVVPGAVPDFPPGMPPFAQSTGRNMTSAGLLRFGRRAPAAPNMRGPSAERVELTEQQAGLVKLTNAEIVGTYLKIGGTELPLNATQPQLSLFLDELSTAVHSKTDDGQQVRTNVQIITLNNILNRVEAFRRVMSGSRETVRQRLLASGDQDGASFLNRAVQQCTNTVLKELYNVYPYPEIRISPDTLLEKLHSLRNRENFVRSRLGAESQRREQENQRQLNQQRQTEEATIAATSRFYASCTNSDILGTQDVPTGENSPSSASCLKGGELLWGSFQALLQHGVRARTIIPKQDWPFAFMTWGIVDYADTLAGIRTEVTSHYARDLRSLVYLGPTTYSRDLGVTWHDNPYPTSPALETIKATQSNALIAGAAARPQGSGCQFPPPTGGRR